MTSVPFATGQGKSAWEQPRIDAGVQKKKLAQSIRTQKVASFALVVDGTVLTKFILRPGGSQSSSFEADQGRRAKKSTANRTEDRQRDCHSLIRVDRVGDI
eukprot:2599933-Rhodomonas_salina.1